MSRRDYPRYDSRRALPTNTTKVCKATGCTKKADRVIFMQFDYMRGNDECVDCCDEHAEIAISNPKQFCAQFPPEAWK